MNQSILPSEFDEWNESLTYWLEELNKMIRLKRVDSFKWNDSNESIQKIRFFLSVSIQ